MNVLEIKNLKVDFALQNSEIAAIRDISFSIPQSSTVALVGESGSGKSVPALALMRLHPRNAEITGDVVFDGVDNQALSEDEMRAIRGRDISMIFQDPMTALNPVFTVGSQIVENIRQHTDAGKKAAWARSVDLLQLVESHRYVAKNRPSDSGRKGSKRS